MSPPPGSSGCSAGLELPLDSHPTAAYPLPAAHQGPHTAGGTGSKVPALAAGLQKAGPVGACRGQQCPSQLVASWTVASPPLLPTSVPGRPGTRGSVLRGDAKYLTSTTQPGKHRAPSRVSWRNPSWVSKDRVQIPSRHPSAAPWTLSPSKTGHHSPWGCQTQWSKCISSAGWVSRGPSQSAETQAHWNGNLPV